MDPLPAYTRTLAGSEWIYLWLLGSVMGMAVLASFSCCLGSGWLPVRSCRQPPSASKQQLDVVQTAGLAGKLVLEPGRLARHCCNWCRSRFHVAELESHLSQNWLVAAVTGRCISPCQLEFVASYLVLLETKSRLKYHVRSICACHPPLWKRRSRHSGFRVGFRVTKP